MPPSLGPVLVGLGVILVVLGALVWSGALSWLGRLPGDLTFERGGLRIYLPLGTMLVVSVVLSVVVGWLRR